MSTNFLMVPLPVDEFLPLFELGDEQLRQRAQAPNLEVNEVPLMFHHRLLSLRAYDSGGMMIGAKIIQGVELAHAITAHFEDPCVEYQHIHNATPGCFNCAVRRA